MHTPSFGRLAIVILGLSLALGSGGASVTSQATTSDRALQTDGLEAENVLLRADVQADGSANWRIEYRVRLTDANATAAFETVQQTIDNNTTR